ncbi:MAG TPA: ABC transporter substrate-binding protein [Acidimicrobiales bacterium]|nr:ABC transporter substrate-binding protein [Acidimicrobiales bacterium]
MRRLSSLTAIVASALITLPMAASTAEASPLAHAVRHDAVQRGGTLVFARSTDILTLDPTNMTDNESIWAAENIYETLYVSASNGHSLEPWLATGYTLSPNHLTWTFHLRHGVRFQNGQPLTSADVKFSIERVSAKKTNPFAFIDAAIANITTPNADTVVITTKYPWAPLLSDMALFANGIIPNNFGGESEAQFFAHPIGTGPFMVKQWVKGSELQLVKNPYYWQSGKPYLDGVTFTAVPDDNTRQLQLESGQAQIDEFPPFSSVGTLQHTGGVQMTLFPSSWTEFLQFNENQKPFQDLAVRRAISYAVDRSAMVQAVLFGHGTVANSILSPALWAHDPSTPGLQYNVKAAKAEMAKSSVPHGFSTTLIVGSGDSNENSLGQIVQAELKPLGINVTLKEVDPNSEYTDIQNGQYQMAFNYDTTDIIDPDEMITFSAMGGTTGQDTKALFTNWNSPQVDTWAEQAERIFDQAQRQQLYDKIQVAVAQAAPMAFLYYEPFAYAYSTKVHGFDVYPTGNYHLENVWLSH